MTTTFEIMPSLRWATGFDSKNSSALAWAKPKHSAITAQTPLTGPGHFMAFLAIRRDTY
jgi:hypothetical protein